MGKVTTGATMSLDGFIADASHGGFAYLFKWYGAGDIEPLRATRTRRSRSPPPAPSTCGG